MISDLRATEVSHLLLSKFLREGQRAVDATAGNGYDTVFLAKKVGKRGQVYAFDIQTIAIERTQALIEKEKCADVVRLINDTHEKLTEYIKGSVQAIVYNLGYLPGGDKATITKADATLSSIKEALELLAPGGVISIVAYPGHDGGDCEAKRVENLLQELDSALWDVFSYQRFNAIKPAPYLLFLHKRTG